MRDARHEADLHELGRRPAFCLDDENTGTRQGRLARLLCGRFALATFRARARTAAATRQSSAT